MSDSSPSESADVTIKVKAADEQPLSLLGEAWTIVKISSAVFVGVSSFVIMKVTDRYLHNDHFSIFECLCRTLSPLFPLWWWWSEVTLTAAS